MAGIAAPSVANYFPKSQVGRAGSLDRREEGGDGRYCCTKSGKLFSRIIGRKGRVTGQKGGGCMVAGIAAQRLANSSPES